MQPMLVNETILSAVSTLPSSIQLLKSMAQILTRPDIKALFGTHSRDPKHLVNCMVDIRELTSSVSNLSTRSWHPIGRSVQQPRGNQESSQASVAGRPEGIDRRTVRLIHKIVIRQYRSDERSRSLEPVRIVLNFCSTIFSLSRRLARLISMG